MGPDKIIGDWRCCLRESYLPQLHGHQQNALAALSLGMALARSCSSGQVALQVPGDARPASVRRRLERLLANGQLESEPAMQMFGRQVLASWPARQVLLILDETPNANDLRCMKLSLGWKKRVVPLLSICYRPDAPPRPLPELVWQMVAEVARWMPAGKEVTLLADRGLCWPVLVRQCRREGWHWVLRALRQCRFRDERGEHALQELVPGPGAQFYGQGAVFKKAGWEAANVVAVWERGAKEPWLLITDQPPRYQRCRSYCRRTWCEQTHRDEKSSGWQWQQSKVDDPEHAGRLVLLMELATLLAIALGAQMIRRGYRKALDPHQRRRLSLFQLGNRWLIWCLSHAQPLACPLARLPP
jgi:hypothetical protein